MFDDDLLFAEGTQFTVLYPGNIWVRWQLLMQLAVSRSVALNLVIIADDPQLGQGTLQADSILFTQQLVVAMHSGSYIRRPQLRSETGPPTYTARPSSPSLYSYRNYVPRSATYASRMSLLKATACANVHSPTSAARSHLVESHAGTHLEWDNNGADIAYRGYYFISKHLASVNCRYKIDRSFVI